MLVTANVNFSVSSISVSSLVVISNVPDVSPAFMVMVPLVVPVKSSALAPSVSSK